MPPKVADSAKKAQPSLFSFFKKTPTTPSENATSTQAETPKFEIIDIHEAAKPDIPKSSASKSIVASPSTPIISLDAKTHDITKTENVKSTPKEIPKEVPKVTPKETPKQTPKEKTTSNEKSSTGKRINRKSVIDSDDEEVHWSDDEEPSSAKKKAKKNDDDDDDEMWSAGSAAESSDESMGSFIVDSESEDDGPKKKKSKTSSTSKKSSEPTSKPPLAKSTSSASKPSALATPSSKAPRDSTSPSLMSFRADSPSGTPRSAANSNHSTPTRNSEFGDDATSMRNSVALPEGVMGLGSHEHDSLDFLQPANRRDKNNRRPDHPDFNPRTLYVPERFLKDQTPAMQQWWQFKSDNMDTVLFFKVGKFYELFNMDADIGMRELDLIYMKGAKAHSGFPEVSYGKFASALVSKGFRVARVEQTETPEMLKERNDNSRGKKDKVVMREMCSILSQGTRTYCHLDDLSLIEEFGNSQQSKSLLLCIAERCHQSEESSQGSLSVEYGLCCVDTVIGTITLAQFEDDRQRTRLRTFLSRYPPSEVVLLNGHYSAETVGCVRLSSPKASMETLRGGEIWDLEDVVLNVHEGNYFENGVTPAVLQAALDGLADNSSEFVVRAIGGCLWQLKRALVDYEVISMGKVFAYIPSDEHVDGSSQSESSMSTPSSFTETVISKGLATTTVNAGNSQTDGESGHDDQSGKKFMTLDAISLANLEILQNNYDRSEKGSMWAFVNHTKTAFGNRLLKDWLCHPLFHVKEIDSRRSAISDLMSECEMEMSKARDLMKHIPDLERLLVRIHSNSLRKKNSNHPNERAVMYETPLYNSRKIKDFADILTGFEYVIKIGETFQNTSYSSKLLTKLLRPPNHKGIFAIDELKSTLAYFRQIFDEKQAKRDGFINPKPGINPDYDAAKNEVNNIEAFFDEYLREMKKKTNISDLKYFGTNKDRFQIEVPMSACSKVPADWTSKSQKKTHRRYWTAVIESNLAKLVAAEEKLTNSQNDTLRAIFEKFDKNRSMWTNAVLVIAHLDALISLAIVSSNPNYVWPKLVDRSDPNKSQHQPPMIHITNGRHPMLEQTLRNRGDRDYIPNSVNLGGTTLASTQCELYLPKMLVLTGPNMGGKSTLLRQTCLIAILAQLGCKVPADECEMTPLDRIFTRLGACDRILAGQSTFFVELAETAIILKNATEDSMCILDELGRGTATFDGTAIAHAVIHYLLTQSKSIVMFATHYHSLVEDWEMDPRVSLGFMDCIVEGGDSNASTTGHDEEVTFLYKLCDGSSPKSYGINVARLAKLPNEVIQIAMEQSIEFERRMDKLKQDAKHGQEKLQHRVYSYFDKLTSLVSSDVSLQELTFFAQELWKRYTAEIGNN